MSTFAQKILAQDRNPARFFLSNKAHIETMKPILLASALFALIPLQSNGNNSLLPSKGNYQPPIIVSTDGFGGTDPDDIQSMIRMMYLLPYLDIRGVISSPPGSGRAINIRRFFGQAYRKDYLKLRASDWSYQRYSPAKLRSITQQGSLRGGDYQPTPGSQLIVKAASSLPRNERLSVLCWGAGTDVVPALTKGRKLRVSWINGFNTNADRAAIEAIKRNRHIVKIDYVGNIRGLWHTPLSGRYWTNYGWPKTIKNYGSMGKKYFNISRSVWVNGPRHYFLKEGDSPLLLRMISGGHDLTAPSWGGRFRRVGHNYFQAIPGTKGERSVGRHKQAMNAFWLQQLKNIHN